jgi:GNAT superfamily N-acetyltransferase
MTLDQPEQLELFPQLAGRVSVPDAASQAPLAYSVQVEHMAEVIGETLPLHALHWREVEQAYRGSNFNPDFAGYMKAIDDGNAAFYTFRCWSVLVGYAYVRFRTATTAKHLRQAHVVHFFVHPEHRRGWLAVRFAKRVIELAKLYGADELFFTAKHAEAGKDLTKLMKRSGLLPDTITYYRQL